jgi:hypothetical protein
MQAERVLIRAGGSGVTVSVKPLKVGQEAYWLDQLARNHEEYYSGHGEAPGRYVGLLAEQTGYQGEASAEEVRAMFRGQDPRTGAQRVAPLWRADPRSKLPATPTLDALRQRAAAHGVEDLTALAGSKALAADIRAIQAAGRPGRAHKVKVETIERVCRKILAVDPHDLYGEAFDDATKHAGKRVDARVAAFDHCFSDPKSVSLLAAVGGPRRRREVMAGREVARHAALGYLEGHGWGCAGATTAPATTAARGCSRSRSTTA